MIDCFFASAACLGGFFRAITPGEWMMFLAELLVAYVIYMEVQHNRYVAFFAKATSEKSDQERRNIYNTYLRLSGTREERLRQFHLAIAAATEDANKLRLQCHNQLAMFNEMGFETNRLLSRRRVIISIFPHAPVYFWFIAGGYFSERRRMTGPWFGQNALIYIKSSIEYVMAKTNELTLGLPGEVEKIVISRQDMQQMTTEIGKLLKEKNQPGHL